MGGRFMVQCSRSCRCARARAQKDLQGGVTVLNLVCALTGARSQGAEDPGSLRSEWRIAAKFEPSYDKACAAVLGQFVISFACV